MRFLRAAVRAGCCIVAFAGFVPPLAYGSALSASASGRDEYRVPPWLGTFGSRGSTVAYAAGTAKRGMTYAGADSEFNPLVVKLSRNGKQVRRVAETWRGHCQSGKGWPQITDSAADVPVSKRGRFTARRDGAIDVGDRTALFNENLQGKVSGKRMSTTESATVFFVDNQSGAVVDSCRYRATAKLVSRLGRVYGGATSQHGAVAIELSSTGKKVNRVHFGWRADCTPDGQLGAIGDTLTNFPITRGAFGDTFSDSFADPDGGRTSVDYSISGTIRRRASSGQFEVTVRLSDRSGTPEAECRTGAVSWNAQSG